MIQDIGLASFDMHRLGLEAGSSAVIGGLVGYATKKIAKLLLVIVGLEVGLLQALDMHGIVDVHWTRLNESIGVLQEIVRNETPPPDIMAVLSPLSVGGGFAGGFAIGFKRA